MITPLIKKQSAVAGLSEQEKRTLRDLQDDKELISAGAEIIQAGQEHRYTYIVAEGWTAHYKLLTDGRQQILSFSLPGDFICLDATVVKTADYCIKAITDVIVFKVPPARILEMFSHSPRLAAILCWSGVRDNAILAEQVVRVGRRNAYESIAHLLLELARRLDIIGKTRNNCFQFPLTQELIADTLGLTTVHVNRTIRKLKKDRLIEYTDSEMKILDLKKMQQIAGFNPVYLEQGTVPLTDSNGTA